MKLIDVVYQVYKTTIYRNREISVEKIRNNEYFNDVELSNIAFNVYSALNNAFSLCYDLSKVEPVLIKLEKNDTENYFLNDEVSDVLNVYSRISNGKYKNFDFYHGANSGEYYVYGVPSDIKEINFEYIRRLPQVDYTFLDIELKDYGISNNIANAIASYCASQFLMEIDPNLSYIKERNASSVIEALPLYGNYKLHIQLNVEDANIYG